MGDSKMPMESPSAPVIPYTYHSRDNKMPLSSAAAPETRDTSDAARRIRAELSRWQDLTRERDDTSRAELRAALEPAPIEAPTHVEVQRRPSRLKIGLWLLGLVAAIVLVVLALVAKSC